MIQHLVVFDFTGITPEQEKALTEAMYGMMGVIPELLSLQFGRNISTRSTTYTHALVETFADMDAVGRYVVHPAHEALLDNFVTPLSKSRAVVDFELP